MSIHRQGNPLFDGISGQRQGGGDPSALPPPPPYSLQAGQRPSQGPPGPAQGQQRVGQGAGPGPGPANAYPPPGSQQMYPPQNSQFAPPPGPPPGGAPMQPVRTGTGPGTGAGAPAPAAVNNVRRQSSGLGSVEALAKRMSMSLTQSSSSSSSHSHHDNPFSDAAFVQSPTMTTNPFSPHYQQQQQQQSRLPSGPVRQGSVGAGSGRAEEDPLKLLKSYDCVFIVDDSSSMHVNEQPDGSMGPSRWDEARDALAGVVELARHYDEDGVDIVFLNSEATLLGTKDAAAVRTLFDSIDPQGPTPTGERLEMLMLDYWEKLDSYSERKKRGALTPGESPPKKLNYIIITDGRPTDEPSDVIVNCARRLDEGRYPLSQIGIQFLQVGNDPEATRALNELDDELSKVHKVRDMVDTTTYAGMMLSTEAITKALLGGINRRLDRQADPLQQQPPR
ncbi:hypothetical protein CF319_g1809 [Tilletia indica]|nr:hypothetical protein CF319_g1809 [Tilletia indica]